MYVNTPLRKKIHSPTVTTVIVIVIALFIFLEQDVRRGMRRK